MALVSAAVAAGTSAAAMYLDAKYHLRKDLTDIYKGIQVLKIYREEARQNRLSFYYAFETACLRPSHGNTEAIWSRYGTYTWAETYSLVNKYGQYFLSQGVRPGDLVAFYLSNSAEFILAWVGLWSIGASPAMINFNLVGEALLHCVRVSGAKLVLVDGEEDGLRERVEGVRGALEAELGMRILVLDGELKGVIGEGKGERPGDELREGVRGDWPMCLFYTSGTTGMPKACSFPIERHFLVMAARKIKVGPDPVKDDDRWYNCMPLYHGTGGVTVITRLLQGITICIGKRFSTTKFWSEVRDSRATWITYVGETARYLLAAPPSPLDKVHSVRAMYGNGLRPDVWFKFRERFDVPEVLEFFSSTEGVFGTHIYARGDFFAACVGHHGALLRIFYKNTLVPVAIDQASGAIARNPNTGFAYRQEYEKGGEMIVAVPSEKAFAGYHNNPEATAKKFERNVFKKGDLWYRTGDALRRDNDGRWFFMDRLGDTFRWKGENVSTAEVSEVLGRYPGVVEANVYGVQLPTHDGRAGCAAIYLDPQVQGNFDFAGLLRHARLHLPKYAVPMFLRIVKEMTPIHNNKQNKVPLREEGVDPERILKEDKLLWIEENGRGGTYVEFQRNHWEDLQLGRARL